jgi:hypothetical protein
METPFCVKQTRAAGAGAGELDSGLHPLAAGAGEKGFGELAARFGAQASR